MLDRRVVSPASTQRRVGGSSIANEAFLRGECGEDGWVTCGGKAPLSQWFSVGLVLALVSFVNSSFPGWVNSVVSQTMALIASSETLCIIYNFLVCPARSSVMDDMVGNF